MSETASQIRKWVPSVYVDEVTPPARDRPEDWIARHENGGTYIWADDAGWPPIFVTPGDVVRFRSIIEWGTFDITAYPNGTWSCDKPIPAEANGFVQVGEPESYATSMDEFVRNQLDAWAISEAEIGPIDVYTWSGDVYFRLSHKKDGTFEFIELAVHMRPFSTYQARVSTWLQECFGPIISADRLERGDRLLEEVLELLQSGDYPRERVGALESYVYNRPKGEPAQEVGGVMVTLAAYCEAHGLEMREAGEAELTRIWGKVEQIRAKQAAKPTGSALPVAQQSEA